MRTGWDETPLVLIMPHGKTIALELNDEELVCFVFYTGLLSVMK